MPKKPPRHPGPRAIAAATALYAPTAERMRHDRVTLLAETILDDRGEISQPYRVHSMLDRLIERGAIDERLRAAGEWFHRVYRLAAMHQLQAADMMREVRYQGSDRGHALEAARRSRDAALDALGKSGSPCWECAWCVLGEEITLRDWAIREGWNGRPIREEVAKGILIGTLGALAEHFGL